MKMDRIINVSDRGSAAIHALALAASGDGRVTASRCAQELGVSPSYLAKVLQALVHASLLASTRGAAGGFELARDPAELTCLEVLEAVDGPLPARECLFSESVCPRGQCALKAMCEKVAKAALTALETTTIAAVAASFSGSAEKRRRATRCSATNAKRR
jgi:Rrf2 family protein